LANLISLSLLSRSITPPKIYLFDFDGALLTDIRKQNSRIKYVIETQECGFIHVIYYTLYSGDFFMNGKRFIIPLLLLSFIMGISGLCSGKDQKSALTVKRIVFTPDKTGGERISLLCNQSCTPELSSLEGKNPRVVMHMKEVTRRREWT
jgi:hypothetical protein